LHEIDVLLVIDEDLRNVNVPLDTIKKEIKTLYESKVGPEVTINIIEVDEIKNKENPRKPPPIVKSYVKMDEGYNVLDSST
jgi:hypothetical protein